MFRLKEKKRDKRKEAFRPCIVTGRGGQDKERVHRTEIESGEYWQKPSKRPKTAAEKIKREK